MSPFDCLTTVVNLSSNFASRLLRKHVYVREIRNPESIEAKQFMDLYCEVIPANLQISADIILDFVCDQKNPEIAHYLFVCKRSQKVVGFVKFMVSERLHYLFIAYLGIDKKDDYARIKGVDSLLKKVLRFSKKKKLDIIAEITNAPSRDFAMRRIVRTYSKKFNRISYTIGADYFQPAMPDTYNHRNEEEVLTLLYTPFFQLSNNIMSREALISIISSIYYNIYAPSCSILNGCNPQQYNMYLSEILDLLSGSYTKTITLNPC